MIKLILFDYDGVIVDSFPTIYKIYAITAKELGVKNFPDTIEGFRQIYGRHYRECYENLGIRPDQYEQVEQIFAREVLKQNPPLFPGIEETVKELSQKYTLVVVTYNYKEEVEQKLAKGNLTQYFSLVSDDSDIDKQEFPKFRKAEMYRRILKQYQVSVDEVVAIGDRDIDITNANQAGIKNILIVNYGWGHSGNHKQKCEINKPKDIITAISKI